MSAPANLIEIPLTTKILPCGKCGRNLVVSTKTVLALLSGMFAGAGRETLGHDVLGPGPECGNGMGRSLRHPIQMPRSPIAAFPSSWRPHLLENGSLDARARKFSRSRPNRQRPIPFERVPNARQLHVRIA
jgi:hypothetical protein